MSLSPPPITRIALAGFGAWGQMQARALAGVAGTRIVAVYCHGAASEAAAASMLPQARRFGDYAAMLAAGGFDVVCVTVPNHAHADFAVAALEAGAHVFLEKPLGITLAQCDAVIAASERTGRLVAVDHELRVSRQWGAVRALVAAGEIGALRHQHFSLFRHRFRTGSAGWRYDPARVGSWTLEELVHFFDLVLWNATENGPPTRLHAFGNGPAAGLVDNMTTVLEWADGSTAVLAQSVAGFEHHTLLELAGTRGAIRTWWSGAMDRTTHPDFALSLRHGEAPAERIEVAASGEVFELEENLRAALAGFAAGVSVMPPATARAAVAVCLAAETALAERCPVTLDLA